jgi:uncharacterized OB-fold protein
MSAMRTPDGHHHTEIHQSLQQPRTYAAHCPDCGWSSASTDNKRNAMDEADEHVRTAEEIRS